MRVIKWDNLDLDKKNKMHIEQSKRRAEVFLPISDELAEMLTSTERDMGFKICSTLVQRKPFTGGGGLHALFYT